MKHIWNVIAAALGAAAGFLWGEINGMFIALLTFIVFDYISGVMAAFKQKKVSSSIGFIGILKKVGILMAVGVAHVLDVYVLKQGAVLMTATQLFFIANEGLSILENLGEIGVRFPKALKNALEKLRDTDNKEEQKHDTHQSGSAGESGLRSGEEDAGGDADGSGEETGEH